MKAQHQRIDAFELWCWRRLLSPLDCKEIQPVHPKGNQSWIPLRRTDAEAPILWPPDAKNWLMWKDHDAGKDWRRKEKGTTEDEIVGWHHWLNGHEFEQAQGVGDGQGGLGCYSSWRPKNQATELNFVILGSWGISPFSCPRSFLRPIFQTLVCLLLLPAWNDLSAFFIQLPSHSLELLLITASSGKHFLSPCTFCHWGEGSSGGLSCSQTVCNRHPT